MELTTFQKNLLKDAALLGIALAAQRWLNSTIAHVRGERDKARRQRDEALRKLAALTEIHCLYQEATGVMQAASSRLLQQRNACRGRLMRAQVILMAVQIVLDEQRHMGLATEIAQLLSEIEPLLVELARDTPEE